MSFVLDNSAAMCWLLADGKAAALTYAEQALDALSVAQVVVWSLRAGNHSLHFPACYQMTI